MRFIPNTSGQTDEMLEDIGVASFDSLIESIPSDARLQRRLELPEALSEMELEEYIEALSRENADFSHLKPLCGAGAYRHFVPSAVNALLSRQEFWTSYTPYQPEMSQGTLQSMFEAQTYFARLSGMDLAVPSIYDGATATAEAALMVLRITHRPRVVAAGAVHPFYKDTLRTYLAPHGIEVEEAPHTAGLVAPEQLASALDGDVAAVLVQSPNFFGGIEDLGRLAEVVHAAGAMLIVSIAEGLSLGLLKGPGEAGADVVACDTNSFGLDLNFGGPHNAFLATKKEYVRQIPGRIAGETKDVDGRRVFVMTLRAREQDIRREKATSNICSNHGLNMMAANIYLSLLGTDGLYELSLLNTKSAHYLENRLVATGRFDRMSDYPFYNEFMLKARDGSQAVVERLLSSGFVPPVHVRELLGEEFQDWLLFATTELLSRTDLDRVVEIVSD
jgi:glycine dehydrogenase subunit 1